MSETMDVNKAYLSQKTAQRSARP